MPKTADFIEETNSLKPAKTSGRGSHPNSLANLKIKPFPKGVSGNPGGKPQYDVAAEIARAILTENKEAAYAGLAKALCKGNAYVFKELAERGYGKLKETKEYKHIHENLSDKDIDAQIGAILTKLGIAGQIDAAEPATGKAATNGHAKDSDLLPR
jgi:hypothetical protein